jgi:DHA2 family multidrug resistance protein
VAPATGPILGGWLTDALSWHWIFLINLPVGMIAFTLVAIFVSEPVALVRERAARLAGGLKLDYFGLFLVTAGFSSMQIFLDKFELDDGFSSSFIVTLGAICAVSLSTLVLWEWQHPQPVMNFRLFKQRNFVICSVVMALVGFVFLSSTQLLPQMAQSLLGYNSTNSGLALALGGMVTIMFMPLSGFITGRFVQPRTLIALALVQMGAALFADSYFPPNVDFDTLSWARILQVVAMPFIFIPISAASYVGMPAASSGEAAAMFNQMRNIGSSIGVSFVTTELAWRTQFHHARIAETITPYGSLHGLSVAQIAPLVQQQASFDSYLDVFRILGILTLVTWPIVLLLKSPPRRAA